ncbi:GAP family protein [Nocardia mexicana]|uniref:Sap-like sulfolipid-1-addressing protein n=1 Tax=Nocardia mexicana TaxID=279262 RepID=A0A370GIL9_9NOCA|nr:GAP family protein [Nocardia mexicana]RDI43642.1 Sap-like sulfolipid-1-addressing protein [Nocardia mexicana]
MGSVIGELLPLAIGLAISPIPIVAIILMLLSRDAAGTSTGFAVGWIAGILCVTTVLVLLSGSADTADSGEPSAAVSWIKIAVGVALIALAAKQWHDRADTAEPGWMRALDGFTFPKAVGLGALLSAVNPKNLLLCVSAGAAIGTGGLPGSQETIALAVFTVLAASTVVIPVVGYRIAGERLHGELDTLKNWLQTNNHMVMAIVLLIMGTVVAGKGIGGL